jgi:hypothetical protein
MAERTYNGHVYRQSAPGQPWVKVGPATIGTRDPIKVADAIKAGNQADASKYDPAAAALENQLKAAQLEKIQRENAEANSLPDLTPAARSEALANLQAAMDMTPMIKDLEDRFKEGPGATKGIQGLLDFLPWREQNERFDEAANKFRGSIKKTQGFTGGEGNSVAEAQMNVGAFIPSASQRDGTIRDNIGSLKRERDKSFRTNIANLGGFPDSGGQVTPVPSGYFVGQYPALDQAIMRKIGDVNPQNRRAFILDSRRRFEAEMRKRSQSGGQSNGVKFLGFED